MFSKPYFPSPLFKCSFFALVLLVSACSSGPSASQHAQKFCACSEELAKAEIQLKAGRIDLAAYQQIEQAQIACMGKINPLEGLKTKKDSLEFEAKFIEELGKQCPNVARNYGFKIE